MNYTLRRDSDWPQRASDVFSAVWTCRDSIGPRRTHFKSQRLMKLFPATGIRSFDEMNLLGPLTKTVQETIFIFVIANRFTRMAKCVQLWNKTAATRTAALFGCCVYSYRASRYVLADIETELVAKLSDSVWKTPGSKHQPITVNPPRTDEQAERFSKTAVQRLWHYLADRKLD